MSPSQASETCASASSATSANGNSLYESPSDGVKKRRSDPMAKRTQKHFCLNTDVCNSDIANSCRSFADTCVAAANNHWCCRNDYDSGRGHRGSQTSRFFGSRYFAVVLDRPNVRHARRGSSQTSRTSYCCPNHIRVPGHDRDPAPSTLPVTPATEQIQKISSLET